MSSHQTPSRRAALLLLALLACAPRAALAQAPAETSSRAGATERGRALARARLAADSLPGLSVAVGIDGQVVWAEGFGWADLEQRRPVTPETRFRVGSVGKALTSAGAGLLVQHGRLDLDAPVRQYVPEFPEKPWPLTTRQLLGHVAGVRDYRSEQEVLGGRRCADVRDGLPVFAADSLVSRPGTRYAYTSLGYVLASAAIQAAAGEPFAAFMQREVFTPLGMRHTLPEAALQPGMERATPYVRSAGLVPAPDDDDSCVLAGGGFLSTPSDLVRFGFGMLDGALVAPETLRMLWTPLRLESGEPTGYGLGWFIRSVRLEEGGPVLAMRGHGGSSVGGRTSFMVFPEQRMVVAVTANANDTDVAALAGGLARIFLPAAP